MYHIHVYRHSFFCQYQIIFTFEWFYTRPTWCLYNWGFRHINCFSYSFTENKKIYKTPLLTMPNSYQNPREYLYLSFPGSICWIKNTETDQGYAAFCRHPYDRVATSFYAGTCSGNGVHLSPHPQSQWMQTESSLEEERAYASELYGTEMIVEAFI